MPESHSVIRIAAGLLVDRTGRMRVVRKRGTLAFIQPGGKIEPSEAPVGALVRELHEELGLVVAPSHATYIGRFRAPAVNEPGRTVEADLFRVHVEQALTPGAEIDQLAWIDPSIPTDLPLATLTRDFILPLHASSAHSGT
ncbi:MAG: NUDIX hydrolase [Janthinobacterium lividum]